MAFCKACGRQLEDGTKFCGSCGAAVEENINNGTNNTNNNGYTFTDTTSSYDPNDIEQNKVVCGISYISILFFLPLVACPNSRFGKFHANQALILLIAWAILGTAGGVCTGVIGALPFIPDFIKHTANALIGVITGFGPTAGMVFGLVNALNGKAREIPLIGKFNLINK